MENKYFLNTDDELSSIAEKIKNSKDQNIALVIPDRALVLSSLASLRLLKRQAEKQKKKLVIVTMDEIGRNLAKTANIASVGRITELKPEIWDTIEIDGDSKKDTMKSYETNLQKETRRDQNLQEDKEEKIEQAEELPAPVLIPVHKEEPEEIETVEEVPVVVETPKVVEEIKEEKIEPIKPANEKVEENTDEIEFEQYDEGEFNDDVAEEPKPKESNDNLDFVVGKDINDVKPEEKKSALKKEPVIERKKEVKEKTLLPKDKNYAYIKSKNFDGIKTKFVGFGALIKAKSSSILASLKDGKNSKKKFIAAGAVAAILFLGFAYAYWIAPKMQFDIEAAVDPIVVEQPILVATTTKEVSIQQDKVSVPAYDLVSAPKSASQDAPATGTKTTGTNAIGKIEITNTSTTKDVTIQKGAVFTCKTTSCAGLTYTSSDNATIPKKGPTTPSSTVVVNVQASNIGDKYNFNFPTTNQFDLTGFAAETISSSVGSFTGGTSKDIKIVAQADVDALKKSLEDQLKATVTNDLKTSTSSENILIDSTLQTKITEEKLDIEVGKEAERFNLTITVTATAQGLKKNDLVQVTKQLVQTKKKDGYETDEKSISYTPTIQEKVAEGQKVMLSIKATQNPILKADDIKKAIKGKSITEAEKHLNSLTGVKSVKTTYLTTWIPGFIRHVPFSESNINLNISVK